MKRKHPFGGCGRELQIYNRSLNPQGPIDTVRSGTTRGLFVQPSLPPLRRPPFANLRTDAAAHHYDYRPTSVLCQCLHTSTVFTDNSRSASRKSCGPCLTNRLLLHRLRNALSMESLLEAQPKRGGSQSKSNTDFCTPEQSAPPAGRSCDHGWPSPSPGAPRTDRQSTSREPVQQAFTSGRVEEEMCGRKTDMPSQTWSCGCAP